MITRELAERLGRAGVTWTPVAGDRFLIPDRSLDDQVFTISEMVVEVRDLPTGRVLAFNGTTEWALDSIAQAEVVWLPREDQLRAMLDEAFVALEQVPGGFVVTAVVDGGRRDRFVDIDAECAYARALLGRLER